MLAAMCGPRGRCPERAVCCQMSRGTKIIGRSLPSRLLGHGVFKENFEIILLEISNWGFRTQKLENIKKF